MPPKKRAAPLDASRLKILTTGDETPFREHVTELLASGNRIAREAALDALISRPLHAMREQLRALYADLDAEGGKRDPGAHMRIRIAQVLLSIADVRDTDIGIRASETYETSMGVDGTANLRSKGLKLVAATNPDLLPFLAVGHVEDFGAWSPEPAFTALQLLADTGHQLAVYQWLVTTERRDPALIEAAVDLLTDAPHALMSRCLVRLVDDAIAREDEPLVTKLVETIVERELTDAYPALAAVMRSGVSKELYGYVALRLAATNRPPLLAILDEQMENVLRRQAIVDALTVRSTPEQEAILRRWNVEFD